MIRTDDDALICDFMETYHIMDYRELPLQRAALFASGLRDDSRIKQKISGEKIPIEMQINALMVDYLALIWWSKTEDGQHNRNRPTSIYERLTSKPTEKKRSKFDVTTREEFDAWYASLFNGEN